MKCTVIKTLSVAALATFAGQASAHVSYGAPLFDAQNDASSVMHLATANLAVNSNQTLTATSDAGYLEDHNAVTWGNSHDNKFMWFSISQPTVINFTITGLANANYNGTFTSGAIDTLQPAFNLFQGNVQYLSHDGAYQPASINTGFAPWSSWAFEALPVAKGGAGNVNSEGNLIQGVSYTTDAGALNGQANVTVDGTAPGVTAHMGVIGSNNGLVPGDTVTMADNVSQTTYADGTPLTNHSATMTFITGEAAPAGSTTLSSGNIDLTAPGIYTLLISGANASDYSQLMADAIATGMGGSEGFQTNGLGLYIQPYTNQQYFDTATNSFTNTASATTVANDGTHAGSPGYGGPQGTPVNGFFVAGTSGTGPGSSYANTWAEVERYSKIDRGARNYSISFNATPAAVPLPAAAWMFLGGLTGLMGFSKRKNAQGKVA